MGNITVNRLPVPTWNSLRVNDCTVHLPEWFEPATPEITAPAGVTVTEMYTGKGLSELDSLVEGLAGEAVVAGKQAIYNEQHFPTALGKDFTNVIDGAAASIRKIEIPEGQKIEEPVVVKLDAADGKDIAEQYMIVAGKDSEASILFVRSTEKDAKGTLLSEIKVVAGENAKVRLFDVNLAGSDFLVLDDCAANLSKNAGFELTQLLLGGKETHTGCKTVQAGEGSQFTVNTGYLAENNQLLDINYHTVQLGRNTESKIYVKGSIRKGAAKVFRGTIDFRKGSSGSVGDEQEDVLLFDDDVVNKTIPVILTEEEDVKGRHGGSMGNLAADTLFYMGTRGIKKKYAEMLVTKGRLVRIAHTIPHEETIGRVNGFIREAFSD